MVLRYSPMAHAAWLRLVAPERHLQQLPVASFRTQTRAVRLAGEEDEPADLVSVFLTPEAPLSAAVVITESDRTQVLDAVIDYGGELLVVIENKVAEDDDRQARELNITGARIRLADGQEAVVVLWRDVLEAFIALRERSLVAGAEADADRRLPALHGGLLPRPRTVPDPAPRPRQLVPADTPTAAAPGRGGRSGRGDRRLRPLHRDARRRGHRREDLPAHDRQRTAGRTRHVPGRHAQPGAGILHRPRRSPASPALRERPGWHAGPNFHFGHMQRGFCWTTTRATARRVPGAVEERDPLGRQCAARGVGQYWAWLEDERIAASQDRPEFDRHFTHTQRRTATPRPGFGSRGAGRSPQPRRSTAAARCTARSATRSTPPWWPLASHR